MKTVSALVALAAFAAAQNVTVPSTCTAGYTGGTDTVLLTIPYTYDQTMSIIGSYKNLTWSGNPDNTVTLNGTDNTVGTARTYDIVGAHVIETLLVYQKPPAPGPYYEVHNTALLTVPSANVSFYIIYDATTVTSVCGGRASMFNFTAQYCGTNGTTTGAVLHQVHSGDAMGVATLLGGMNFTSCAALGAPNATATMPAPAMYTGGVGATRGSLIAAGAAAAAVLAGLAAL